MKAIRHVNASASEPLCILSRQLVTGWGTVQSTLCSVSLSCEDAHEKNDRGLRIKGATGQPRFSSKMSVENSVCICGWLFTL